MNQNGDMHRNKFYLPLLQKVHIAGAIILNFSYLVFGFYFLHFCRNVYIFIYCESTMLNSSFETNNAKEFDLFHFAARIN